MLDFAQLPPEVNSALMYAGPGSGPMLAAAAAWEALAAELQTTASTYDALITGLADGPWQGSSAASMVAAATPQVAWLRSTAGQAEQAGSQAVAAASAYEAAFFATVPPPEIAAASWAHISAYCASVAAMYGYAGASAAATQLSPFNPAAQTINPAGLASQAASVGQAVSGAANAQALTDIPKALFGLSGIFTNEPPWLTDLGKALGLTGHTWSSDGSGLIVGGVLGDFVQGVTGSAELDASVAMDTFGKWVSPARLMVTQFKDYFGLAHDLPKWASEGAKAAGEAAKALPAAVPAIPSAGLSGVAGAVGQAASVGGLKVPAVWTATTPAASPAVLAASNGLGAAAAAEGSTHAFGGMPLMGSGAGRAFNNFAAPRYGFKPTVIAQPPAGG